MRRRAFVGAVAGVGTAAGCALAGRRAQAAAGGRVLIVATSAARAGPKGRSTGVDLIEVAEVYWALRRAGHEPRFATIAGGPPPIDEGTGGLTGLPMAMRMDPDALGAFGRASALAAVEPASYAALLLAGGLGALWDFPGSRDLGRHLEAAGAAGRPVAAVDHGVAGLLAPGAGGGAFAAGRRVTGPTDAEEHAAGRDGFVPFSLEGRLREAGARFEAKGMFLENTLRDGALVTAQNQNSAGAAVGLLIEALAAG